MQSHIPTKIDRRAVLLFAAAALLAGCSVVPVPLDPAQRESVAIEAETKLFAGQEPLKGQVTLYEATARAL